MNDRTMNRRVFLQSSAAGLAIAGTAATFARAATTDDRYGGFKMGIQSYSLRTYDTDEALAKTKELKLQYWESFNKHVPVTDSPEKIAEYKKKLAASGVHLIAYGVQRFDQNSDANRKQFEFAKAMGIRVISADPTPESFDDLDKLVEEFNIAVAIHNHGPGSRYSKIDDVVKAIRGHHELIGACVDTGHFLRSDEDPVKAIEIFGSRNYGVHLKDVKHLPDGKKQFTILGKGDLDVAGCLRQLKRLKFEHCLALEYEENEKNPMSDIRECLATVEQAAKRV